MLVMGTSFALSPVKAQDAELQYTPGPNHGKSFDGWTLRCRVERELEEICETYQQKLDADTRQVVLHTSVGRLSESDAYGMVIILPLGISLAPGVYIQIDDAEPNKVSVERCDPQGCRIELLLEPDLLQALKAGSEMVTIFYTYDSSGKREPVGVPLSLSGFTSALEALEK